MNRFYRLSRRDQLALLTAAVAMLVYGFWFGIIQPLHEQGQHRQQQVQAAAETLSRVQVLAGQIAALQSDGQQARAAPRNLPRLVDRSLRENGLSMSGFQPGRDGDARLRLESADFGELLQWLYQLEYVHQVRVGELSITAAARPGVVSAQVQLLGEAG